MNASLILLVAMIVVTAVIAVYRWIVSHQEDDFLHIDDPSGQVVANQRQTARALTRIDHIGIGLTVATALYAVALLITFLYRGLH
jgi:hypothetical protein